MYCGYTTVLDSFFGQCIVLPDFVLYSGDESGVDGDEDKGVDVCKGDLQRIKIGCVSNVQISDVIFKMSLQE